MAIDDEDRWAFGQPVDQTDQIGLAPLVRHKRQREGQRANRPALRTQRPRRALQPHDTGSQLVHAAPMNDHDTLENYAEVRRRIGMGAATAERDPSEVTLTVVSKTHDAGRIQPLLDAGHRDFGENRVQEATAKWPDLRAPFADVTLRLIGPLQSNKAAEAVATFDIIETIDREKIARVLAAEMAKQARPLPCYVQVNTGEEDQKAGIAPADAVAFAARCRGEHGLDIVGLMCIPPVDAVPGPHFALLAKLAREAGLPALSMGMSNDYEAAVSLGATSVRVGSAIFGARPAP